MSSGWLSGVESPDGLQQRTQIFASDKDECSGLGCRVNPLQFVVLA